MLLFLFFKKKIGTNQGLEVEAEDLDGADVPLAFGEVLLERDEYGALVKMQTAGVAAEAHRQPQSRWAHAPVPRLGQHHIHLREAGAGCCGVGNRWARWRRSIELWRAAVLVTLCLPTVLVLVW